MPAHPSARKIVTVIGARPQFIKASAVSARLRASPRLREVVVHTGQHFDSNMSDVFFAELGMDPPAYHCAIHGGRHGDMTGRMLAAIEALLLEERPDAVLVYGDTNSTLAGALAAVKLHIPVAHVEAGLRSFNPRMPEEINRTLTDRIAHWLFTPNAGAGAHLLREGAPPGRIEQVGDVMYDVALHHGARVDARGGILGELGRTRGIRAGAYCLATIHRAENTDDPARLAVLLDALMRFSSELPVILPLHPRTRQILAGARRLDALERALVLVEPQAYLAMVQLEKYAALVATDSGGVQKEAFFHRVPCVTFRDETEWVELLDAGWNRLAPPTGAEPVLAALRAALGSTGQAVSPYGDGDAAERIVQRLALDLA
ncbi:UDP-N-acetylglucosamine 2-epimerase (non-hydrolyzing) [Massilia sp. G4R7]|uniref:UDP-N-acetylglucosamine 2-epimerase (Non-hydrolyzing) n=1 Tax=Massilia phyllostachyos TaxID=2898585 RepID=A0ABS8Q441_9BURK|nr:UDP-N-acetylglucosamine 2-epimerase (non-hydrolyzing) [Massilia phyllostachyos]MCD2516303.1 UDP-N-acetylglucosamine 2-epimerase (non-hydrolyzing) [Massilia phyllostachyos]